MGIKLLGDERIEKQDGNISLTIKVVTTSQKAAFEPMGYIDGKKARIDLTVHALLNFVESISIDGQNYNPILLANKADPHDVETTLIMLRIGEMVYRAMFPSVDDIKKS